MTKEVVGKEVESMTSVVIKDLVNSQIQTITLITFDKTLRLINLSAATTLKLSNANKNGHLTVDNSLGNIEFFTF